MKWAFCSVMHMISAFIVTWFFFFKSIKVVQAWQKGKPKQNSSLLTHVNQFINRLGVKGCGDCLLHFCPEGGNISLRIYKKTVASENDNLSPDIVFCSLFKDTAQNTWPLTPTLLLILARLKGKILNIVSLSLSNI